MVKGSKGSKTKSGLGRSLMKSRITKNTIHNPDGSIRHTTVIDESTANNVRMQSITQENDLDAFITSVQLAETDFVAERQNIAFVDPSATVSSAKNPFLLTAEQEAAAKHVHSQKSHLLTIPRRPKWSKTTTKEQLKRAENESFLNWRRQLVYLEERDGLLLTPYERNAEVWKQLWRVVERSDIVVQIVDARNPLLFRSTDLESYVSESHPMKKNILLINKADMLTNEQRIAWADYFEAQGIKYYFFSAAIAKKKNDLELENELIAKHQLLLSPKNGQDSPVDSELSSTDSLASKTSFEKKIAGFGTFGALLNNDNDKSESESENEDETKTPEVEKIPVTSKDNDIDETEDTPKFSEYKTKRNKKRGNKYGNILNNNNNNNSHNESEDFSTISKPSKRKNKAALLNERLRESVNARIGNDGLKELKTGATTGLKPSRVSLMISEVYNEQESIKVPERAKILSVDGLLRVLHEECPEPLSLLNEDGTIDTNTDNRKFMSKKSGNVDGEPEARKVIYGFVGYPNVGKSSTLNALCGAKKVTVSSTPGKTKHFQTIHLPDGIILCDCPGLVFPSFATTKAELVCNGILPIDQLREYTAPAQLVAERIPRDYLESVYGIQIFTFGPEGYLVDRQPSSEELLQSYAVARGYTKSSQGNPDESRAARYILKDFINGKLLFSHPPPGIDGKTFNAPIYKLERMRKSFVDEHNTI